MIRIMDAAPEQFAADLEHGRGRPDPRALALAGELQDLLPGTQVLLFGSRAMGTWHPESDIDLAVIGGDRDAADEALRGIDINEWPPGELQSGVQILHFETERFEALRTSLPHIAGQVQRYGLTPNGEQLPQMAQTNLWPKVQENLQVCARNLGHALRAWDRDNDAVVSYAHGAVELAIKAVLVANGINLTKEKRNHHRLAGLRDRLPIEPKTQLNAILPDFQLQELANFRVNDPYAGLSVRPTTSVQALLEGTQQACDGLAVHALAVCDKQPHQVNYEEWLNGRDALGGWATLALDHFTRVYTFRGNVKGFLTDEQIADVERNWARRRGAPADAITCSLAVRADPSTWRSLFIGSARPQAADNRESDDTPPPKGGW